MVFDDEILLGFVIGAKCDTRVVQVVCLVGMVKGSQSKLVVPRNGKME